MVCSSVPAIRGAITANWLHLRSTWTCWRPLWDCFTSTVFEWWKKCAPTSACERNLIAMITCQKWQWTYCYVIYNAQCVKLWWKFENERVALSLFFQKLQWARQRKNVNKVDLSMQWLWWSKWYCASKNDVSKRIFFSQQDVWHPSYPSLQDMVSIWVYF